MTAAERKLKADGWRLVHTTPLVQSFHFERFDGRRRIAAIILVARSTARAWGTLRKILKEPQS